MNILKLVGLALVLVLSIVAVACGETVTRDSDTVIAPTENVPSTPETEGEAVTHDPDTVIAPTENVPNTPETEGEAVTHDPDTVTAPTENVPWEPETEQVNFSPVPGCRVVGGSPPNIQVTKSVLRLVGETDISGGEPHVVAHTIRGIDQRALAHIEAFFPEDPSPEVELVEISPPYPDADIAVVPLPSEVEIVHGPPPSNQQHSDSAVVVKNPSVLVVTPSFSDLSEVYCAIRVSNLVTLG